MKIQAKFWQKRRLVSRTAPEKPSRIGYRSADLKIVKVWSDVAPLRCARMKRRDKILNKRALMFFDTKYDEKRSLALIR